MKSQSYMTRALRAKDPRFARILGRLGYAGAPVEATQTKKRPVPKQEDPRVMLRAEYERVLGKKAFGGWSAEQLQEKIAAAQQPEPAPTPAPSEDNE